MGAQQSPILRFPASQDDGVLNLSSYDMEAASSSAFTGSRVTAAGSSDLFEDFSWYFTKDLIFNPAMQKK